MNQFRITNRISAVTLGTYPGATAADALDAMAIDQGYADYAELCAVAPGPDDEMIVEPEVLTYFRDTAEAADFIATASDCETSREIMESIAFFARNTAEAEKIWENGEVPGVVSVSDIWENVTKNGLLDAKDFCWGAAGSAWYPAED